MASRIRNPSIAESTFRAQFLLPDAQGELTVLAAAGHLLTGKKPFKAVGGKTVVVSN